MSRYINLPTLAIDFMKARGFGFDVKGSAIEGGRNTYGEPQSIGITGGGVVSGSYECLVHTAEQHEYVNWLGARLNGSYRFINVPIRTDFMGPFPVIDGQVTPIIKGIPHSDGSLFSDDTGYSQATVWGQIAADAAVNAGQITIDIVGASRRLRWSDWFSIHHPTKGWRAYRYWEASEPTNVNITVDGVVHPAERYTLSISPALRDAVTTGTHVEFARPRFAAKFPSDFTLEWTADLIHMASPTIPFVEAF